MADFDLSSLFADKNFISALAGAGAKFGRGGAGEAIGVPTQQWIQSEAAQKATAKSEAQRGDLVNALLKAAGLPGLTPKDQPGITSIKAGNDGTYTLDITAPNAGAGAGMTPEETERKAGGTKSDASKGFKASDIIPFF